MSPSRTVNYTAPSQFSAMFTARCALVNCSPSWVQGILVCFHSLFPMLIGNSGSGKTTLLNVLARRAASGMDESGELSVNGSPIDAELFREISCYVEQEDALVGSLTVEESLRFAAKLSLPSTIDGSQRYHRVLAMLQSFGLQNQAKVLVGTPIRKGISGGQKRRLSVASQLITGPTILFLDEPTSGLDSAASFEVMSYIRKIARKYKVSNSLEHTSITDTR